MSAVRAWLAQAAAIVVEPTPRHVDVLVGLLETGTATNLVNDAHRAALALELDAVLVSFDADFGRFAGLRREVPAGSRVCIADMPASRTRGVAMGSTIDEAAARTYPTGAPSW